MITLSWHELVSWFIAVVSAALFFAERRKNDNAKYYMVLQGILRACGQRSGFLASMVSRLRESERDVSREEFHFVSYLLDSGSPNLLRSGFAADTRGPSACSGLRRPGDRVASKDRLKGA